MNDLLYIIPEIFLIISSLLLLPITNIRKSGLSFLLVVITIIITLYQQPFYSVIAFNGLVAISPFIHYMKTTILILVAMTLLMLMASKTKQYAKELPLLMIFSTIGMLSLVGSHDLLSMYMAIELQSLPMYVMAAINRRSLHSSEAGIKYFILGALASGILLYGISILYGFAGSTSFTVLTQTFHQEHISAGLLLGVILIICALAFKIAAAPFHMWIPDVYEGAPTIVTAFFAIVPKLAFTALLIRLFNYELANLHLQQIFIILAIFSMVVSALGALRQQNFKRMLAYSSIGHMGYILISLAASIELKVGVSATVLYITLYSIMNIGLFSFILLIPRNNIKDLAGLNKKYPFIACSLVLLLLSMAGIPPTAGFFTKLYVLSYVIKSGLWWLALIALLISAISAYYYLRILKTVYFDSHINQSGDVVTNRTLKTIMVSIALINLTFVVYGGGYLAFLERIINFL